MSNEDPFMARMAAEKSISGPPDLTASGPLSSTEYAVAAAERGIRPPGRPTNKFTQAFG